MSMECESFRQRVAGDPAQLDAECAAHARGCAPCAAFAERVRNAEWLIQEALRFDVDGLRAGRRARRAPFPSRRHWAGVAAVLVAVVALWVGFGRGPNQESRLLVAEILEHWHEEPDSWVTTDVRISPASLETVTSGSATVDAGRLGLVSYARSCYVRDRWIPHLVVQGEEGPVMLLLLPHEPVSEPLPLALPDEGLRGVIVPVGGGSVAVLGSEGEALEPINRRVADAVEWSI